MISTAKLSYLRIAPRKVRLVADLIRGTKVEEAQTVLSLTRKKAALPMLKLLKQAIANAKNVAEQKNLYISQLLVDEGPKYKRTLPRARGRADVIHKKTSHISMKLDEIKEKGKKKAKTELKKTKEVKTAKKKEEKTKKAKEKIKHKPKDERLRPKRKKIAQRFFRRKAI